jgi:hypothetical protein
VAVSGDRHLLGLSLRGLTVLSPRELWQRLGGTGTNR